MKTDEDMIKEAFADFAFTSSGFSRKEGEQWVELEIVKDARKLIALTKQELFKELDKLEMPDPIISVGGTYNRFGYHKAPLEKFKQYQELKKQLGVG